MPQDNRRGQAASDLHGRAAPWRPRLYEFLIMQQLRAFIPELYWRTHPAAVRSGPGQIAMVRKSVADMHDPMRAGIDNHRPVTDYGVAVLPRSW